LPSKWHIQFLPPIHLEQQSTVKAISQEVRDRMQQAVDEILRRRRSIFWGPVFTFPESS